MITRLPIKHVLVLALFMVLAGNMFFAAVKTAEAGHAPVHCYTPRCTGGLLEGACGDCAPYFEWDRLCLIGCQVPLPFCFEEELGVPALGGFDPSGISFFAWFTYAALALAAVLALVFLVIGGIRYVGAAGNAGGQTAAKETIKNAILGLILALAATLVLYTINPSLTEFALDDIAVPPESDRDLNPACMGGTVAAPSCKQIRSGIVPSDCPEAFGSDGGSASDTGGGVGLGGSSGAIDSGEASALMTTCAGIAGASITSSGVRCNSLDSGVLDDFSAQCSSFGGTYDGSIGECVF